MSAPTLRWAVRHHQLCAGRCDAPINELHAAAIILYVLGFPSISRAIEHDIQEYGGDPGYLEGLADVARSTVDSSFRRLGRSS